MTLLLAKQDEDQIWMIGDTAVTDKTKSPRHRENAPKIYVAEGPSLIGFAGDVRDAQDTIGKVLETDPGRRAIDLLLDGHRRSLKELGERLCADFCYAFIERGVPQLVRVAKGKELACGALHLGSDHAFSRLSAFRQSRKLDHAPEALHNLIVSTRLQSAPSNNIMRNLSAIFRLFPASTERDVGGWPTPYRLTAEGAELCGVCFNVTDPIVSNLEPGDVIPHGSAEGGGFGFSLTELNRGAGLLAYWLQGQLGYVFLRESAAYHRHEFSGTPEAVKAAILKQLGLNADIWFSNSPLAAGAKPTAVLNDTLDRPRALITADTRNVQFTWLQKTEDSFEADGSFKIEKLLSGSKTP
jgi:hypothetical protein